MNVHRRPNLVEMDRVNNLEWSGVGLKNSMRYHMQPHANNAYFHDFEIYVDIVGQFHITSLFWDSSNRNIMTMIKDLDIPILSGIPGPTFPLNTDGIDYYGKNATFRNIKITNFDDTIVPKPLSKGSWGSDCT